MQYFRYTCRDNDNSDKLKGACLLTLGVLKLLEHHHEIFFNSVTNADSQTDNNEMKY